MMGRDPLLVRGEFIIGSEERDHQSGKSVSLFDLSVGVHTSSLDRESLPPEMVSGIDHIFVSEKTSDEGYLLPPEPEKTATSDIQSELTISAKRKPTVERLAKIYAQLVRKELECQQAISIPCSFDHEWSSLLRDHENLLQLYYEFLFATQHPQAEPNVRKLASQQNIFGRMWFHGAHSLLECLRKCLPASADHMISFIYYVFSMMSLVYDTMEEFKINSAESLGDIICYRMHVELCTTEELLLWSNIASYWYMKASQIAPTSGRFYNHLATIPRLDALRQYFFYSKSLCAVTPYTKVQARRSVSELFKQISKINHGEYQYHPLDSAFLTAHSVLFANTDTEGLDVAVGTFLTLLANKQHSPRFRMRGALIATINITAMLGVGSQSFVNPFMESLGLIEFANSITPQAASFDTILQIAVSTLDVVLSQPDNSNGLPFVHVTLAFMHYVTCYPRAIRLLEKTFPWQPLSMLLNTLLEESSIERSRIESSKFPFPLHNDPRPLPEDLIIRGFHWATGYHPETLFERDLKDEEKCGERNTSMHERKERILWLAYGIGSRCSRLQYGIISELEKPVFSALPAKSGSEKLRVGLETQDLDNIKE